MIKIKAGKRYVIQDEDQFVGSYGLGPLEDAFFWQNKDEATIKCNNFEEVVCIEETIYLLSDNH